MKIRFLIWRVCFCLTPPLVAEFGIQLHSQWHRFSMCPDQERHGMAIWKWKLSGILNTTQMRSHPGSCSELLVFPVKHSQNGDSACLDLAGST